ncbi:restriction endonuclease [Streptomyces sp. KCTC 0041BP]|uniref:restriction endonuclease n=1 Tax=Streptomyces sp. KCTC 0041BP TaxID=201500 RepID=UPI001AE84F9A|nr:restriction endonuclease [Streptomyces sp. KCTC 0041BP]MBP0937234.1 restriction endonuclease [Streptomyces sp. KCTC 0041BP]
MHDASDRRKTINPSAYLALVEGLTHIFWNKDPFELYLRGMLKDHSELLARLDFGATKREVSGQLVNLLRANEARYLDVTVALMLDIAAMETFPNLTRQVDGDVMVVKAKAAVGELRRWTAKQQEVIREHEAHARVIAQSAKEAQDGRAFAQSHEELKQRFLQMHAAGDPHKRGTAFEGFLNDLFALYDLEPRAAYSLAHEQIDGAFAFNTDHYVLEAKWWKEAIGRRELDVFKANIERKGKNTLGLYVSMSGYSSDALAVYSYSTPFITMDGLDFMAVLDQRIRLDDLLDRKKRHASQTGHCYLPVAKVLAGAE